MDRLFCDSLSRNVAFKCLMFMPEISNRMVFVNGKHPNSVLWKRPCEKHGEVTPLFTMNVTGFYRNDAMLRQISESVRISHVKEDELIITKAEWNYLPIPRTIITRM